MYIKKVILLTLVLSLLFTTTVLAKPIIKSDNQYFDPATGLYVLKGNVYIEVKDRIITAGTAKVDMISMEVWGSEGITFTQKDISFTGESVYIYGPQAKAVLNGGVHFSRTELDLTADSCEFNWKTKIAVLTGNVTVIQNGKAWTTDSLTYNVRSNTIL